MKLFLIITVVFLIQSSETSLDNEFVTFWAPKRAENHELYHVFFLPNNIDQKTQLSIEFEAIKGTVVLNSNVYRNIDFQFKLKNSQMKRPAELTVTLLRNDTVTKKPMCISETLEIKKGSKQFFIFIQLDKPMYKPGDEIKSRVIVVDRHLKPYHINNILVKIRGPNSRTIYETDDLINGNYGILEVKYKLTNFALIGDWKIEAIVDKNSEAMVSKIIPVKEYLLPLFDVKFNTDQRHYTHDSAIKLSFYAQYSFGKTVAGNAELVIINKDTGQTLKNESFSDLKGIQEVTYEMQRDLKLFVPNEIDKVHLNATVIFEEPESELKFNKTINFWVHGNTNYRLKVNHAEKYQPGVPFVGQVAVYDWQNNKIKSHHEKIFIKILNKHGSSSAGTFTIEEELTNGYVSFEYTPDEVEDFELEVSFLNAKTYKKKIEKGRVNTVLKGLDVSYFPKNPKINQGFTVYVKNEKKMDDSLVVITSQRGIIQSKYVNCYGRTVCILFFSLTEEMMPHSTITAYHVVDMNVIHQGQIVIKTDTFGKNELGFEISLQKAQPKQHVSFELRAYRKSKVFILGVDERLSYLREGNDVTIKDIQDSYADYDNKNHIITFKIKDDTWHECNEIELERVNSGEQIGQQNTNSPFLLRSDYEDDDVAEDIGKDNHKDESYDDETVEISEEQRFLREEFPETWIFETIAMNKEQVNISFTVPDSITTWIISAFSATMNQPIAVAPTKKLVVEMNFFIKMNLPYSIRFKEVLRLDILIYNYVENKKSLDVTVKLLPSNLKKREFEFITYPDKTNCNPSIDSTSSSVSKKTTVSYLSVKKVSFFIRSSPNYDEETLQKISFKAYATATDLNGTFYKDLVKKRLTVEPVGTTNFEVKSKSYKLAGDNATNYEGFSLKEDQVGSERAYQKANFVVTGNYLTKPINFNKDFYPKGCPEQRTSILKRSAEYYRFLKATNQKASKEDFYQYYQEISNEKLNNMWSYWQTTAYQAYLAEVFVTILELDIIKEDKKIIGLIENALNNVKKQQTSDGSFPKSIFPQNHPTGNEAIYFATSHAIIPFLKYRNYQKAHSIYQNVIDNAFRFLNDSSNILHVKNLGLSTAAYAYALNGLKECDIYSGLIKKIENGKVLLGNDQKCFKLDRKDENCDLTHTVYAALAYIESDDIKEAIKLVNWILDSYSVNDIFKNTRYNAISTEAIAKLAGYLDASPELTIDVYNEAGLIKTTKIDKKNAFEPKVIEIPNYSTNISHRVSGRGYCSVSTILEKNVYPNKLKPLFNIDISKRNGSMYDQKLIKICVESLSTSKILNVIYDVQLPSGYIFAKIANEKEARNYFKYHELFRKGTLLKIYLDNAEHMGNYCIEFSIVQQFKVINLQKSSVKVYNYDDKTNLDIEYYTVDSDCEAE